MNTTKSSVADIVTDRIIAALATGVAPWRKPWRALGRQFRFATNLISGKPYNGVNQLLLQCSGYVSPYWLTFKQAAALGGSVRKGEKGTPVIYVGRALDKSGKKTKDGKDAGYSFLRYYTVFNVEQCDGLDSHVPVEVIAEPNANAPIDRAEAIWAGYADAPRVSRADKAFYAPALDYIGIPDITAFDTPDSYYSTLFHEGIHSTGAEGRLNREGVSLEKAHAAFASETYGKEELVAELGAAFLCAEAGIDNIPASASYCASWIKVLKGDSSLIISAAAAAQKAYRHICPAPETAEAADE
jgi:antirestriction protein ArdC